MVKERGDCAWILIIAGGNQMPNRSANFHPPLGSVAESCSMEVYTWLKY